VRILHVQETLSSRYGGPARLLPQLADAQQRAGLEVAIATTNADYPGGVYHAPGETILDESKVRVRYCSVALRPLKFSVGLAFYLRKTISTFDIVHIHGLYRFPPTYAAWLARKRRVPYIIRPHGSLDPFMYGKSSRSVPLKRLYERWFDFPI